MIFKIPKEFSILCRSCSMSWHNALLNNTYHSYLLFCIQLNWACVKKIIFCNIRNKYDLKMARGYLFHAVAGPWSDTTWYLTTVKIPLSCLFLEFFYFKSTTQSRNQDRGQAIIHDEKSTSWSRLWGQNLATKNATFAASSYARLNG